MGKSCPPRTWRPPIWRQQPAPTPRLAGPGGRAAWPGVVGRKEAEGAVPAGPRVRTQGDWDPGRRRHGVPGAAAAPAGRVGRAHWGLVPRPRAEQVHQQLPPLLVAVLVALALGPASGEWGDARLEGGREKATKTRASASCWAGSAVIFQSWG